MAFDTRYHTKLIADRIGQSAAEVLEEFLNKLDKESVENSRPYKIVDISMSQSYSGKRTILLVWKYI